MSLAHGLRAIRNHQRARELTSELAAHPHDSERTTVMKKPKVFSGKNGDRNLLIAIALAGAVGVYFYKKKKTNVTVSGLLPAYRG
jgi:hypothetical protein